MTLIRPRHCGTSHLDRALPHQQYHSLRKHAPWCFCSHLSTDGNEYHCCNVPFAVFRLHLHQYRWHRKYILHFNPKRLLTFTHRKQRFLQVGLCARNIRYDIPCPSIRLTSQDYIHTFTILIIACFFTIKVFTVNEISSAGHLWELMVAAGGRNPVSGNQAGSYLTMTSKGVMKKLCSGLTTHLILLPGHRVRHHSHCGELRPRHHGHKLLHQGILSFTTSSSTRLCRWWHCIFCHTLGSGHFDELGGVGARKQPNLPYISTCKCQTQVGMRVS